MLNTCKSNETKVLAPFESGERVSNAWVTYPLERNSLGKLGVMPYKIQKPHGFYIKRSGAIGWTRVPLASW